MDYCSSCRRHLNGALVCPGCGAYAPDIAPTTADGHDFAPFAARTPPRTAPRSAPRPAPRPHDPFEETGAAEAAVPVGEGRAARRRQRARWKKNQRRAVVATTVALVGGGLTISTMGSGSDHRDQASAAPDFTSTGAQDLPSQQYAEPTTPVPGTGKHRKPDSSAGGTAASGDAQRRAATTPDAPRTASERTQPYSAPHTTPSQSHTATTPSSGTAPGGSGSSTPSQSPSAAPGSTSTSGSSGSGSSGSGSSQSSSSQSNSSGSNSSGSGSSSGTSTAPSGDTATTSPSGICVLGLLCLS